MGTSVATTSFALLCVILLCEPSLQTEKHSLYYIYTALSKPVNQPGIHQFTAMGLLDDREMNYYNSQGQKKIPRQTWMKEKMDKDYWEKDTQSRKSKEQQFSVNFDILIKRMGHNESDVHVLQWRHGCEIEKQGDEVKFSKGIDEYSYDGDDFLTFDDKESLWVAPVAAALPTKEMWDNMPIINQYTKGYLEKECVDWLNKFRKYGDEQLINGSPPEVHVFAKRSSKTKLKLTCLATGFYPKDVMLTIRKYPTSLPENEIESSRVRPNHDGTFQLKNSVEIPEVEKADYDCFVFHRTFKEPIIIRWDGKCLDCGGSMVNGIAIGAVVVGLVASVCLCLNKTKRLNGELHYIKHKGTAKELRLKSLCGSQAADQVEYIPIEVSSPFELVGMDLIGKLTPTENGHEYICVLIDYFTKWPQAYPLRSKSASEVTNCIVKFVYQFEAPKRILTDQGREYVNAINRDVCQILGITRSLCAPYHPQTNGLVEKMNGTIQRALGKLINSKPKTWDQSLDAAMFRLRTKKQITTKHSPFFLMFGRETRYPSKIPEDYQVDNAVEEVIAKEEVFSGIKRQEQILQILQKQNEEAAEKKEKKKSE